MEQVGGAVTHDTIIAVCLAVPANVSVGTRHEGLKNETSTSRAIDGRAEHVWMLVRRRADRADSCSVTGWYQLRQRRLP